MKAFFVFLLILLMVSFASAAILRVASDGTQPYSQISAAVAASASGDTILVMGGGYTGFTVPHRLVVIGAGTGMGVGEGVQVNGAVIVEAAADSTELRSLWIKGQFTSGVDSLSAPLRVYSGAERVFIWRCFIENLNLTSSSSMLWLGNNASADVVQCILWTSADADASGHYGILHRAGSSLNLTSSVIANCERGLYRFVAATGSSVTVRHCIFTAQDAPLLPLYTEGAGVVENSVFLISGTNTLNYANAPAISYSYCAANAALPPGATHIATTTAAFVNMVLADARASDYHLPEGSNLIDAGNPGSPSDLDNSRADIGIYGGQHPYVEGGVPDYPFAVQVKVPFSAPLNGTMRIWGRGRVGPGN